MPDPPIKPPLKFHHTKIMLQILSERPIGDMDIEDIVKEMESGDFVGHWAVDNTSGTVGAKRAANLLHEFGSEPGFFNIDDEGRSTSETDYVCPSGRKGWQGYLRDVYDGDEEQWRSYDATYGLASRLGYDNPVDAWNENPLIHGSTNPVDFGRSDTTPPEEDSA